MTMRFFSIIAYYVYKCTFKLIDTRLGFVKYTCPDLANRGYYMVEPPRSDFHTSNPQKDPFLMTFR